MYTILKICRSVARRKLSLVSVLCVVCGVAAGCGQSNGSNSGPIKIGFLAPLSGSAAAVGKDTQLGAQLAIDQVNATGGIKGRPVQLDVADSQFDPNVGAQVARRFANDEAMPLMLGSVETAVLNAQLPISNRQKFPTIATIGAGPNPRGKTGLSQYIIYPFPACSEAIGKFAQYEQAKLHGSWGGISWDDVAATACMNAFESGSGSSYTASQVVPITATDMSGAIAKLHSSNPAGLFVAASGQTPGLIARQARQAGWQVPMFGWSGYEGSSTFTRVAGDTANGFELLGTFAPDLYKSNESQSFVAAFEQRYHQTPTVFQAAGYDAALLGLAALRNVGTDREKVNSFLHNLKGFPTASAPITIRPDGGVFRDLYVQQWQGGALKGVQTMAGAIQPPPK
jgi:branched-chain amino acid transport system substrate-binding protein